MNGILPLYKDRGMTSNDCVMRCRHLFHTRKVGHSGTLDPAVAGVLPICIGHATKVVNYLMASGKVYQGELILGKATETEDLEGAVVAQTPITTLFSVAALDDAMAQFQKNLGHGVFLLALTLADIYRYDLCHLIPPHGSRRFCRRIWTAGGSW